MARKTSEENQRRLKAIAILIRNTTWKCGKVERLVVNYLRSHLHRYGMPRTQVGEMLKHLRLHGKQKSEFFDALKRLEKRRIIRLENVG